MGQHGSGTNVVGSSGKGAGASTGVNSSQLSAYQNTNASGGGVDSNQVNSLATAELQRRSANAIVASLGKQPTSPNAIDNTAIRGNLGNTGPAYGVDTAGAIVDTRKVGVGASGVVDGGIGVQNPKADSTGITRGSVF